MGNSGSKAEDKEAKAMLEGIWVDTKEEDVSLKVKGDSIYYPDSMFCSVKFQIINDSLVLNTNNVSKYKIIRQTENIFEFLNASKDTTRLIRSENKEDSLLFMHSDSVILSSNLLESNDTTISYDGKKYRYKVNVSPSKDKVYKSGINDDGLEVESLYYDNIVHLNILFEGKAIFSKDFKKDDFSSYVPKYMLKQCILSDIEFMKVDKSGFHLLSKLSIPDSPSSFIVEFKVSFLGEVSFEKLP